MFEASGRTKYTTVAVAGGRRAGRRTPSWSSRRTTPGASTSGGPSSRPATAATGSGLATKVHNLRRVQEQESGRTAAVHHNAEVNGHMIAVNEALGFRPVERLGEFQKKL